MGDLTDTESLIINMTTTGSEIVLVYLAQEQFAELPRLTLAKMLYNLYPECFTNVEGVRKIIRYYSGATGEYARKVQKMGKENLRDQRYGFDYIDSMPRSEAEPWEPFSIQKASRRVLVLSDLHVPYHNEMAIKAAIEYGISHEADTVFINGDLMDFHRISRFLKDPRSRNLNEELEAGRQMLTMIRVAFPNAAIYYKLGNHDERLEHYLILKAPELLGCTEFTVEFLLRCNEHGITTIDDKRVVMLGKLPVIHGHEVFGSGSVNPARTLYLRAKASALQGHNHRTSEHTEKDIHGHISTTWSTGCLCELNPRYMPINNHNHGFAFVFLDDDGHFEVKNKRILNGVIL